MVPFSQTSFTSPPPLATNGTPKSPDPFVMQLVLRDKGSVVN